MKSQEQLREERKGFDFLFYMQKHNRGWFFFFLGLTLGMVHIGFRAMREGDYSVLIGVGILLSAIAAVFIVKYFRFKSGKSAE